MDFTNFDHFVSSMSGTFTCQDVASSEIISEENNSKPSKYLVKKLALAKENKDLIQLCIHAKNKKFLSRKELIKYGKLALNTAALDADDSTNFREFASKRITLMIDRAIAEAKVIALSKENIYDNKLVGLEFSTIQQMYRYN
jgi:hypothetical protein